MRITLEYHLRELKCDSAPNYYELYGIKHMCNGDALYCSGTREKCLERYNDITKDYPGKLIDHDLEDLDNE